ncbi:MAG: DUF2807 domain-containing protein, partial [Bacteroidota bacterium]
MKKLLTLAIGVLVAVVSFAQSEETRKLPPFSKISVGEGIDVFLKQGDKESARVIADNFDIEEVLTEVSGEKLRIHLDKNWWESTKNVDIEVYVTYVSISGLAASSSSSIVAENDIVTEGDFDVDVSSSGEIKATIK